MFIKRKKDLNFQIHCYSRVFMFIQILSPNLFRTVQQPVVILILTVNNRIFDLKKKEYSSFSDVSHGPPTANITGRHVGDLGNITTDENGTAYINITDSIIQLYNTTQSIINRTFVVHAMLDDGGHTGIGDSNTTG